MDAALGHVSAGGSGTPEFDVTHSGGGPRAFVASQSGGNAGGPTLSKLSLNPTGMEQGGWHEGADRGVAARWAMAREELIALNAAMPAATKNSEQKMLRIRAGFNSRCRFLIAKQTFLRQSTDGSQYSSVGILTQGGTRCPQRVGKKLRLCRLITAPLATPLSSSSATFA